MHIGKYLRRRLAQPNTTQHKHYVESPVDPTRYTHPPTHSLTHSRNYVAVPSPAQHNTTQHNTTFVSSLWRIPRRKKIVAHFYRSTRFARTFLLYLFTGTFRGACTWLSRRKAGLCCTIVVPTRLRTVAIPTHLCSKRPCGEYRTELFALFFLTPTFRAC